MTTEITQPSYFDLHITGLGYLNRIREITPKKGQPFLACDIAALTGPSTDVDYCRFDVRVSGAEAQDLIRRCAEAVAAERKVLIGFRLGDLWADVFTYPLRTAIFGFSSQLQLVHGRVGINGNPAPSPYLGETTLKDCNDLAFDAPRYLGLAALDECLLFMETNVNGQSFYDHSRQRGAGFLTDSSLTRLTKRENGQIRVTYDWHATSATGKTERHEDFDAVIMTLPSWIIETHIQLENFNQVMLPYTVTNAYKTAHWETSCKVYAPLKKSFLSKNKKIPQIMVTDSFIHDVYTYRYHDAYPYDCILLSYTWEDDASKLAAFDDQALVNKCVTELDRILLRCTNIKTPISPYIDTQNAVVQRWMTDKNALGCAKLYRAGTYYDAVSLMQYNRDYSPVSGLYLAGESFSVDAGWTEPCLRGAVDAVINLCHTTQATFNGGFTLDDYPRYQGQSPIQQQPTL